MTGKTEIQLQNLIGKDGLAQLSELKRRLELQGGRNFVSLASTANVRNPALHIGSPRKFENTLTQNVIVKDTKLFGLLVDYFHDSVERIFLDVEKKSRKSDQADAIALLSDPKVIPFKPNDLAVEAAIQVVINRCAAFQESAVGIVGDGNISFKLSLQLIEHGYVVRHFVPEVTSLEAALKHASGYLRGYGAFYVQEISHFHEMSGISYLLGASNGRAVVLPAHIRELPEGAELLDVGNGTYTAEALAEASRRGFSVSVLSVEAAWKSFMIRYFETEKLLQAQGERAVGDGIVLVSRGMLGRRGHVLVDNIMRPSAIIGICDGEGDLLYGKAADSIVEKVRVALGIN